MKRRRFLIEVGKSFPVVVGLNCVMGCSDPLSIPPDPDLNLSFLTVTSSVVSGHSHSAVVATDDIASTTDRTYVSSVAGADNHNHEITLTAADFATLRTGASVTVTSKSSVGHVHEFTFRR